MTCNLFANFSSSLFAADSAFLTFSGFSIKKIPWHHRSRVGDVSFATCWHFRSIAFTPSSSSSSSLSTRKVHPKAFLGRYTTTAHVWWILTVVFTETLHWIALSFHFKSTLVNFAKSIWIHFSASCSVRSLSFELFTVVRCVLLSILARILFVGLTFFVKLFHPKWSFLSSKQKLNFYLLQFSILYL